MFTFIISFLFWFIISAVLGFFYGFIKEVFGTRGVVISVLGVTGWIVFKISAYVGFGWAIVIVVASVFLIVGGIVRDLFITIKGLFNIFQ